MPGPFVPVRLPKLRLLTGFLLAMWVWVGAPVSAASAPAALGERGMVVSPESLATGIGLDVLQRGGNAIDAGVAVSFALTVTYPQAAPIGGGGFLLYRDETAQHHALDFRERAPAALTAEVFLDEDGRPIPDLSLRGGLAVGVPGSVAGLAEAHRRWGSLSWAELVKPAIRLARKGFPVYPQLARLLADSEALILEDESARSIFTRGGHALRTGKILIQRDLGSALRRIARQGPSGFYRGPTAEAVVATVSAGGGVMTLQDLLDYEPVAREPLEGRYRGYRVVSFPPPSSGGIAVLQMLGMLERFDLRRTGPGSSLTVHLIAEIERRAYADRSRWLGDPAFFDVPTGPLLDFDYLTARAASVRKDRATPSRDLLPGDPVPGDDTETLHFSIADSAGRAVSMTLTLNAWFGTCIVAEGTGVLLNNEIDDFALAPGIPNTYGLLGGEANAVAGGKRPLSSMTPTMVELPEPGPRPFLVLGSPGGSKIITSVLQVLINVIDHDMPLQEAVDAPRFHHQWQPDHIRHEPRSFAADVLENLKARGHALEVGDSPLGNVNAIGIDSAGNWLGAADPRREGSAEGY